MPAANALILASKVDQAKVCYDFAQDTIRYGKLKKYISKRRDQKQTFWIRPNDNSIYWTDKKGVTSKVKILPSTPEGVSGPSCSLVIMDEIAEWNATHAQTIYDRLAGAGASRSGLFLIISTPQFNREHLGFKKWSYAKSLIDGEITDIKVSPWIFGIPNDAKCICDKNCNEGWQCIEQVKLANPAFDITVPASFYVDQLNEVKNSPISEAKFRTLYGGQWVGHAEQWLSITKWGECKTDLTLDDFKGEPCIIGLDASQKHDLTCYVMSFERDGLTYFFPRFFMLEKGIDKKEKTDRIPYKTYARNGLIQLMKGERISQLDLAEDIINQTADYQVKEFRYDPAFTETLITNLEERVDFPLIEVEQKPSMMTKPTAEFERRLISRDIRHPNNAIYNWCAENVVCKHVSTDGEIMIDKRRSHSRIDGISASVTALSGWMANEDQPFILPVFA